MTKLESGKTKATALGVIPFQISKEVNEKFEEFEAYQCNWLELTIVAETIELVTSRVVDHKGSFQPYISEEIAR